MSGGSYDYLCFCDVTNIFAQWEQFEAMYTRLEALPNTELIIRRMDKLREIKNDLEFHIDGLDKVWKAVEWCDSNDMNDEDVSAAIEAHNASYFQLFWCVSDEPT